MCSLRVAGGSLVDITTVMIISSDFSEILHFSDFTCHFLWEWSLSERAKMHHFQSKSLKIFWGGGMSPPPSWPSATRLGPPSSKNLAPPPDKVYFASCQLFSVLWLNYTSNCKCLKKWIGSVLLGTRRYNFQSRAHTLSATMQCCRQTDRQTDDSVMPI